MVLLREVILSFIILKQADKHVKLRCDGKCELEEPLVALRIPGSIMKGLADTLQPLILRY